MEAAGLILFLVVIVLILFGYPVGLTLGGISIIAGLIFLILISSISCHSEFLA